MNEFYRIGPGGLSGNEDMGSLSSWYILSAMGIYPMAPGSTVYTIGSPIFEEVQLNLAEGKSFSIKTKNNSKENQYIQSATLNGQSFNQTFIDHSQILKGGTLEFTMGPKPNKAWGSKNIPPSMSK